MQVSRSYSTSRESTSAFPSKHSSYYDDLEVPVSATKPEIRRAFLKLAKRYHPDTATDDITNDPFQRIQLAYDVLSDDLKRREYDWKSRGIWRHSPSGIDPLDQNSEFQQQRREFWRQWEERKKNGARESGEENSGLDGTNSIKRFRYTEFELAEMEAAARASRLEYQQRTVVRLREIGKKREELRRELYKAAQAHYASKIESYEDDDYEKRNRFSFNSRHIIQSLRRYWEYVWTKNRFVISINTSS